MKYKSFTIKNYKAIEDITLNFEKNVIPLIGINESGKTSILHAILAFDKDKDGLLDGVHIDPNNKYRTTQKSCELISHLIIESEKEYISIGQEISLNMNSPLYNWLKSSYEQKREINISRDCIDNVFQSKYSLVNEVDEITTAQKTLQLVKSILGRLPNILYFDDFSDRVPEEISFPPSYLIDGKLNRSKDREWQQIIEEIFSRALKQEFSLKDFLSQKEIDVRDNYLNDVEDILNDEIVDEWRKLKTAYRDFSEDAKDLSLAIKYSYEGEKHVFKFKVIDSEGAGSRRIFDISLRSKGFQWFFNFIMKLKFNPKYKHNPNNAIYLLDEPGSYLHSSAQTELLKKLCDIGKDNKIIYCTHSQYLLDPEIINIAAIKIVSKDNGKIQLIDYGSSDVNKCLGAFSALNDALHLKFGFHGNILKSCILTEGIVDFYFFEMFCDAKKDVYIVPGAGAGHLKDLISIMISCAMHYAIVLDYDGKGRSSYSSYLNYFDISFKNHAYQYEGLRKDSNDYVLENLLSAEDITRIKNFTSCDDIKNAIVKLYFSDKKDILTIYHGLSEKTKSNLKILKIKLEEILNT